MPRRLVGAVCLCATLAPAKPEGDEPCPLSATSPGPEELLRFSHALRRDGRLSTSAACYERLSGLHPRFADGWYELGLARHEQGRLDDALSALEQGLRLRPLADGRMASYALLLQEAGRMSEARGAYHRALARSPLDADARYNLGLLEESAGDHEAALRAYRAALALDPPDEARLHNNIGGILAATGQLDAAVAAYQEALDAEPALADGWYNLGSARLAQARHAEAEVALARALRLAPAHAKAVRKLELTRASALVPWQSREEAEHDRTQRESAERACAASVHADAAARTECVAAREKRARAERLADGPAAI